MYINFRCHISVLINSYTFFSAYITCSVLGMQSRGNVVGFGLQSSLSDGFSLLLVALDSLSLAERQSSSLLYMCSIGRSDSRRRHRCSIWRFFPSHPYISGKGVILVGGAEFLLI